MRGEATRLSIAVRWTTAIPWLRRDVGSTWDFDVTTMGMSMSMIWMLYAFFGPSTLMRVLSQSSPLDNQGLTYWSAWAHLDWKLKSSVDGIRGSKPEGREPCLHKLICSTYFIKINTKLYIHISRTTEVEKKVNLSELRKDHLVCITHICHGRHGRRPCKFFLAGVIFFQM